MIEEQIEEYLPIAEGMINFFPTKNYDQKMDILGASYEGLWNGYLNLHEYSEDSHTQFLRCCCRNKIIDFLRNDFLIKSNSRDIVEIVSLSEDIGVICDDLWFEAREMSQDIHLNVEEKLIFIMRLEGYTYREIKDQTDFSIKKIHCRITNMQSKYQEYTGVRI